MTAVITPSALRAFADDIGQSSHATCHDVLIEAAEALDAADARIAGLDVSIVYLGSACESYRRHIEKLDARVANLDAAEKRIEQFEYQSLTVLAICGAPPGTCVEDAVQHLADEADEAEARGRIAGLREAADDFACSHDHHHGIRQHADRLEAEAKR